MKPQRERREKTHHPLNWDLNSALSSNSWTSPSSFLKQSSLGASWVWQCSPEPPVLPSESRPHNPKSQRWWSWVSRYRPTSAEQLACWPVAAVAEGWAKALWWPTQDAHGRAAGFSSCSAVLNLYTGWFEDVKTDGFSKHDFFFWG